LAAVPVVDRLVLDPSELLLHRQAACLEASHLEAVLSVRQHRVGFSVLPQHLVVALEWQQAVGCSGAVQALEVVSEQDLALQIPGVACSGRRLQPALLAVSLRQLVDSTRLLQMRSDKRSHRSISSAIQQS